MTQPWEEGYEAYMRNFEKSYCPYPSGTPAYDLWMKGYREARRSCKDVY